MSHIEVLYKKQSLSVGKEQDLTRKKLSWAALSLGLCYISFYAHFLTYSSLLFSCASMFWLGVQLDRLSQFRTRVSREKLKIIQLKKRIYFVLLIQLTTFLLLGTSFIKEKFL